MQEEAVALYEERTAAATVMVTSLQEETVVTVSLQERTAAACLQEKATMDAGAGGGGRGCRSWRRWSWMQEPAAVVMMWVSVAGE